MAVPPPGARPTGALFERQSIGEAVALPFCPARLHQTVEDRATDSRLGDDGLFAFESELEGNLTYIPLAVRFKLDRCGVKLSLQGWQRLPERRRHDLLQMRCDSKEDLENYRKALCTLVTDYAGEELDSIPIVEHPPWATDHVPDQLVRAATALGFPAPSSAQWCGLDTLQRFALLKLSREGREHRNLGAALREHGLL